MNVAKVIRIIGYLVYTAIWAPILAIYAIGAPIVCLGLCVRAGRSIKECLTDIWKSQVAAFKHDWQFIQTGLW